MKIRYSERDVSAAHTVLTRKTPAIMDHNSIRVAGARRDGGSGPQEANGPQKATRGPTVPGTSASDPVATKKTGTIWINLQRPAAAGGRWHRALHPSTANRAGEEDAESSAAGVYDAKLIVYSMHPRRPTLDLRCLHMVGPYDFGGPRSFKTFKLWHTLSSEKHF